MIKCSDLRSSALQSLRGNWKPVVLATLVYFLLAFLIPGPSSVLDRMGLIPSLSAVAAISCGSFVVGVFFIAPLQFGYCNSILEATRGDIQNTTHNMFHFGFGWKYGRSLGTMILVAIYTFLWSLLLIIPGIIKTYAYSMALFVSRDYPDIPVDDCIYLSRKLMNGYKFKLFCLQLSFLGWFILSVLTCGIGFLWLVPYYYASVARMYETLKAEHWKGDPIEIVLERYHNK